MPNVQQKKLTKDSMITLVFLVLMIVTIFMSFSVWIKLAIDVGLLGLFVFIRRAYLYFAMGATAIKKKDLDKAFRLLEKALKVGVDDERTVMVGSAHIQQGDPKRGIEILESFIARPKKTNFREMAIVTCSMGYWRLGDLESATKMLEDLAATGYRDDNLSINLETYLLQQGELKKAKALITEARKGGHENNGLLDNRGWYYIQSGDWKKASEVYDELIDERNARFPEAYLHGAQASIHANDISQAIDRLGWGASKNFLNTCTTSKDYIEKLLLGLENPATREAFAKAMEDNAVAVSMSKEFPGLEMATAFDENAEGVMKPQEKKAVTTSKPSSSEDSSEDLDTNVDDDDREPNTDLDDSDEALASEFGQGSDESEDEDINTDVDDDDREPNTDLGEDD